MPSTKNLNLSSLSILKLCFLEIKITRNNTPATPKRKNASDKGDISLTINLAAIGVKDVVKIKKRYNASFFIEF